MPEPQSYKSKGARPLTPDLLVGGASVLVGFDEETEKDRGQAVRLMLREVRQPVNGPWHTAFVHHAGYWSHFNHIGRYSSWPLPATGDPNDLARFAREVRVLSSLAPEPGEIFLLWSMVRSSFIHAGIVAEVMGTALDEEGSPAVRCLTIEGNTGERGQLNGRGMHQNVRTISPRRGDRFIRWALLDGRGLAAEPREPREMCMGRMVRARAA